MFAELVLSGFQQRGLGRNPVRHGAQIDLGATNSTLHKRVEDSWPDQTPRVLICPVNFISQCQFLLPREDTHHIGEIDGREHLQLAIFCLQTGMKFGFSYYDC